MYCHMINFNNFGFGLNIYYSFFIYFFKKSGINICWKSIKHVFPLPLGCIFYRAIKYRIFHLSSSISPYEAPGVLVQEHGVVGHLLERLRHVLRDQVVGQALAQVQGLVLQGQVHELNPGGEKEERRHVRLNRPPIQEGRFKTRIHRKKDIESAHLCRSIISDDVFFEPA